MRLSLTAFALASMVLLAGCSSPDDGEEDDGATIVPGGSTSLGSSGPAATSSHVLTLSNFPEIALSKGSAFNFNLEITGADGNSDHIGAHFGLATVAQPTVSGYTGACNHLAGTVPGNYVITCTAPNEAGTFYLRGHLRLGTDPGATHAWSAETTFTVA